MSLISILLFAVAVLTLMIGLMSFLGSSRTDRKRTAWVLASDIGAFAWIISIAVFLGLDPASAHAEQIAVVAIDGIYICTLLMVVAILGYASWQYPVGKVVTVASIVFAVFLAVVFVINPEVLYSSYELSHQGNKVILVNGWYYWTYATSLVVMISFFTAMTYYRAKHTTRKRAKVGDFILTVGFIIVGVVSAIFNLILPLLGRYDLIWLGPLSLSITMMCYFYAILKYRIISVSAQWLQVLAQVVLLATGAAIYMVIFYIIFTALFKIPNPSASVLVLNFIMIVIVLLLMPVIREIGASLNSLISMGKVDIAYVIKKLNHIATRNVDLRDLAGFLADHLHFAYIGFIINGRVYGSKSLAISPAELSGITHLRAASRGEIWQEPNKTVQKTFGDLGLYAVAELRNAKGKAFGQIIVGRLLGKTSFDRRDLLQLEMIINLVATVIDSEKHLRA